MNGSFKVLVFDPGEHTGWSCAMINRSGETTLIGGTVDKLHLHVATLIDLIEPNIIVMESFHLYPGFAKSLSWNSFYPCETIGVIRYLCQAHSIPYYEQAPSIKKFSGGLREDWKTVKKNNEFYVKGSGIADRVSDEGLTEHSKDAYLHWKYFARNTWPKIKDEYLRKHYGSCN